MSNRLDGVNVIHIVCGDEANNQDDDKPVASTRCGYGEGSDAATSTLPYGGDGALLSDPSQIPKFGSSSFVMLEGGRSYKVRHCKQYSTDAGCPYGDNCIFIHDERTKTRESLAVIVAPSSHGGYRSGAAAWNDGGPAALPPLAPLPARPLAATTTGTTTLPLARRPLVAQTMSSGTVRPLYYRTRICSKWHQYGHCQYGNKCYFAHGEAELQRLGSGPGESEANSNNQRAVVQNLPSTFGLLATPALTSSAAATGGSGQMAGAIQRSIPSRNSWKVPKKINGIYGDWIDGHDIA